MVVGVHTANVPDGCHDTFPIVKPVFFKSFRQLNILQLRGLSPALCPPIAVYTFPF